MLPAWHDIPRWLRATLKGLALALAYLAGGLAGDELAFVKGSVSPLWPSAGVAVAGLAWWGRAYWPAVLAGALATGLAIHQPAWSVPVTAAGNTAEALVAAWALGRWQVAHDLGRIADVLRLLAVAVLAPVVSAMVGPPALAAAGAMAPSELPRAVALWWLGDAMGMVIAVPVLLTWVAPLQPGTPRAGHPEQTAMAAAAAAMATLAFGPLSEWIDASLGRAPLTFMVFPPLLWAAIRGGPRAASLTLALTALVAVLRSTTGHGPFAIGPMPQSLVLLELFLAAASGTILLLASAVCVCHRLIDNLRRERCAADAMRVETAHLMATIRHDLAHPLQAATLFLAAMRMGQQPESAPLLDRTVASLRAMEEMLSEMKEVTSLEAGGDTLDIHPVPLTRILDLLAAETRVLATAKGLEFRYAPCAAVVRTDPVILARMVRNLLSNAVRYTERGSVLLGCRHSEGSVRIEIHDTGPGIPSEAAPRLFDAFRRGSSAGEGVGLGLSIVRRLAAHLGCEIGVQSEPGRGSCFWVRVPLER